MPESKIETIKRLYDEGASLDTIVVTVGHDDETIRLIGYRLGLSTQPGSRLNFARKRASAANEA